MRLLEYTNNGELSCTKDFIGDDKVPAYAILSHTWQEGQEVTFDDLKNHNRKSKSGYDKIRFCAQQAHRDGLRYFWVDTCCIDKSNHVELQNAINSMFRWYQEAVKCYVYLTDVSFKKRRADYELVEFAWEPAFRESRWFTRGWTLQELLAPRNVEFFSREGNLLGDKGTLQQQIREITGIPVHALQGVSLGEFSVEERMSWTKQRRTTYKEDKVYSLLGIFGIYMLSNYGEGEENAFKRLQEEINKDKTNQECIKHLRLTDPRDDKKRIEDTKGGLLKDSYRWVLVNSSFQQWHNNPDSPLLWVKGDPGKGKTMLLCGIINELQKSVVKPSLLSYFFCQATDLRINSAVAVLRGLLYLLVRQQPSLVSHVRKRYDYAGKSLFEDANAWVVLTEIFTDVLQDPSLNTTYLIVDALDECITDLLKLLDFVTESSMLSRVKWIISSRNWPDIEERLERAGHKVRLSLELNAVSVSTAVTIFIQHKVSRLAQQKKYDKWTQDAVLQHLTLNANDTFLWVALVCQNLESVSKWNVLKKLNSFPPGLNSLYERMMQQLSKSDDAQLCKQILAVITLVYQPLALEELTALVEELGDVAKDQESIQQIISLCGSFLTLRENSVYFVHQSTKDFLLAEAADLIFPCGREDVHYTIFARSLQVLSRTLRRDMYGLESLGYPIEDVKVPNLNPLAASRYLCLYWVDHVCDSNITSASYVKGLQDGGIIDVFLREKYLYWLEALSLCKSIPKGIVSMATICSLVQVCFKHNN
jgi:hypothetical protein